MLQSSKNKGKIGLVSLLAATTLLSGCGYRLSQEKVDRLAEDSVRKWIERSDRYLEVYDLLERGDCQKAKIELRYYLRKEAEEGEYQDVFCDRSVSENAKDKLNDVVNEQIIKLIRVPE
jgi:hypothetical protein